ncbi:MAG: protein kinase [Planctomycetaceae bacterium]
MSRVTSTHQFLQLLESSQLLAPKVVASVRRKVGSLSEGVQNDPRKLAATLANSKIITSWQARRLLSGKDGGFYVGRYKLLDLLGSGGMGRVYLAEHLKMHQLVAIKILRPVKGNSKISESQIVARFAREAQAIAALSHPNIVQAFDFDEVGSLRYLVMEFVEGANAATQLLKTGPLPYEQVADYICQAAAGLKHAHDAGLVHRDVKPANILIDQSGHVKLVDLGLVSCLPDATDDGLTVDEYKLGTVDFIAPEQALSSHDVDPRADIYALGGSFYRLISGKLLFPGLNTAQKLLAQQTKQPTPIDQLVPDLPAPLVDAINKMLAKDRNDRFADVSEVIEVLEPFAKRLVPPYDAEIIPQTRSQIEPFLRRGPASLSKPSIKAPEEHPAPSQPVSAPDLVPADSVLIAQQSASSESSMTTMQVGPVSLEPEKKQPQRRLLVGGIAAIAVLACAAMAYRTIGSDSPNEANAQPATPDRSTTEVANVPPTQSVSTPEENTQTVVAAKPVLPPTPPPRQASNWLPLLPNTGFEVDTDDDVGWPDTWPRSKTDGVSWIRENDNHFVRLNCLSPGEVSAFYRAMPIPQGTTELQVSWRQRISGLVPGERDWFDARMTFGFMHEDNSDLGQQLPPSTKVDTDGWETKTFTVAVPEEAARFKVRPCLNQVQAGQFDVDNLVVLAKVDKPSREPKSDELIDSGAHIFAVMPKATDDYSGDGVIDHSDEYILITNNTNAMIDLTGFELSNSLGLLHILPHKTRLWPNGEVRILTAELNGHPTIRRTGAWNDSSDRIVLANTTGQKVAEQYYLQSSAGKEIVFISDEAE